MLPVNRVSDTGDGGYRVRFTGDALYDLANVIRSTGRCATTHASVFFAREAMLAAAGRMFWIQDYYLDNVQTLLHPAIVSKCKKANFLVPCDQKPIGTPDIEGAGPPIYKAHESTVLYLRLVAEDPALEDFDEFMAVTSTLKKLLEETAMALEPFIE